MHFKRTEIQNFKSIEKMSLNFSSGVNLLIGDNGVGKTTVLEALALSVQTYFSRMNDITKKWTGRRRDWGEIHSQLEIFFADRISY